MPALAVRYYECRNCSVATERAGMTGIVCHCDTTTGFPPVLCPIDPERAPDWEEAV
jgi:hypothetical protein